LQETANTTQAVLKNMNQIAEGYKNLVYSAINNYVCFINLKGLGKKKMEKNLLFKKGRDFLRRKKIYRKLENNLKKVFFRKKFLTRFNHNLKSFYLQKGLSSQPVSQFNDHLLIDRLKAHYLICNANFAGNKDSQWSDHFNKLQGDIHSAFVESRQEVIVDILRNPANYNLFYGFENMSRDLLQNKRLEDILEPELAMDSLLSLCEAVGIIPFSNPESLRIGRAIDPETAVGLLDQEFGFTLDFPNPFAGEYGIKIKRGIISYRAIQAIYQAWKIANITKDIPDPCILEIGGGLGRTAYYCRKFGIYDYTIVDIPISSLAQGNFLGRVLPEGDVTLMKEQVDPVVQKDTIKLIYPDVFFSSQKKYDLIVNVDSLTELDIVIAKQYLEKISEAGTCFFSINHEINSFSINSIWKEVPTLKKLYRNLNWVRRGYVEEFFKK